MFDEFKKLPEEQKRFLRLTVTMTSMTFLGIATLMWVFQQETMELLGIEASTLHLIAGILCAMVVIDLIFVKTILGEDKAK